MFLVPSKKTKLNKNENNNNNNSNGNNDKVMNDVNNNNNDKIMSDINKNINKMEIEVSPSKTIKEIFAMNTKIEPKVIANLTNPVPSISIDVTMNDTIDQKTNIDNFYIYEVVIPSIEQVIFNSHFFNFFIPKNFL